MTPAELQSALTTLELSPAALAKLLGVDVRTTRRWATGGKAIPETVATQISEMLRAGAVPASLIERRPKETEETTRFLWVRRKDDEQWTVGEHDVVQDVYFLPGRVERFTADELELGPVVEAPTG